MRVGYGRRERKGWEVEVLDGCEAVEIRGGGGGGGGGGGLINVLNISQSKKD